MNNKISKIEKQKILAAKLKENLKKRKKQTKTRLNNDISNK